jgi:hypothetical protein
MRQRRRAEFSAGAVASASECDSIRGTLLHKFAAALDDSTTPREIKVSEFAGTFSALWQHVEMAGIADDVACLLGEGCVRRLVDRVLELKTGSTPPS